MQYLDFLGLSYSANSNQAVGLFEQAIESYLQFKPDTMAKLNSLTDQEMVSPMAQILKGYLLKMGSDPRFTANIQKCLEWLNNAELNHREKLHLDAFKDWLNDDINTALDRFELILETYPTDIIALKAAHNLYFYQGDADSMHRSVARVLPAWEEHSWKGYVLGLYSFGLEESGHYERAETTGREAVTLNPNDLWAAHAVTHVCQMQSRWQDGQTWLNERFPDWTDTNNFVYHLHWHQALLHLSSGDSDAALEIYDQILTKPLQDDLYLDVCNAASMLWRLQMQGHDVTDRWRVLQQWQHRATDDELIFITLHYLMAPAVLNDKPAVKQALETIRTWGERSGRQASICKTIGLKTAEAIVELGQERTISGIKKLKQVEDHLYTIGGSHAQRQLFSDLIHHYSATS
ncbi:MAG: tetratricopeptide repeat protein [Gammaproteobacteria bacterium]|jgi:tetratricopeptide (TPR) repeat protein|nr:tetratricopeptide repeat protein [Gammaproteobacteria bacterium]MBT5202188.1 tetratricopeptide repeat protein [Gammaproteobacteria bacterium]MBT5600668.1 tetratricopeptide repeat protein [Gammaproteobacteria bacterium]MBT6247514.1 tetratricopeptide repeat protein [Gammaproteobacteria bacterium]